MTEAQAVILMDALCRVSLDAQEASHSQLQTTYRADLAAVRLSVEAKFAAIEASTNEKIFNATLKTDMQSKHWREGQAKDTAHELASVRAELNQQRTAAEAERVAMRKEMESRFDKEKALSLAEMEKMVRRRERSSRSRRAEAAALFSLCCSGGSRLLRFAASSLLFPFLLLPPCVSLVSPLCRRTS